MAPPPLQRQLSAFIDRAREAADPTSSVLGETLDEWRGRQAAWDGRAAEARVQWGIFPEVEEEEVWSEPEMEVEPLLYDQTFFKLREVTPLSRLKQAFCQRKGVEAASVHFVFGGVAIEDERIRDRASTAIFGVRISERREGRGSVATQGF